MADAPKKDAGKLVKPELRKRLHAWWEGYEYGKPEPPPQSAPAAAADATPQPPATHPDPIQPPLTGKVVVKDLWPRERIKVAQLVWGDGFTFPGSVEFVLKLAAPLGLGRDAIGLDLGCGLGAGTRALAQATGAWLEGYDLSPDLAQNGAALSRAAGMDSKAPIGFLDAADGSFKPKRYDGVLARNVFSPVSDKPKMLTRVAHGMKPGAKLVAFDWGIAREDAHGDALDAYRLGEATAPRLATQAQFAAQISAAGLGVVDNDDITAAFRAEVLVGWAQIDQLVSRGQLDSREGEALMAEAKLWARRLAAMDSGDLRVVRIVAAKKA
jgi:SAM-dependent methyltransferase